MRWLPINNLKVEEHYGEPFLLFAEEFKDPDFNPSGVVEGFFQDGDDPEFSGWMISDWNNDQDCYNVIKGKPTHYSIKIGPGVFTEDKERPLIEIGQTSRGYTIYRQESIVGGWIYLSDEIGGGAVVYDAVLIDPESVELALKYDKEHP
jgi:hypothetical protein